MCSGLIPAPPVYITEHGVLWNGISVWLLQVSCPRYVPSQLHVHLLTDRVRETEKLLTQDKGYLTIVKNQCAIEIVLTLDPKPPLHQLLERKLTLSQRTY